MPKDVELAKWFWDFLVFTRFFFIAKFKIGVVKDFFHNKSSSLHHKFSLISVLANIQYSTVLPGPRNENSLGYSRGRIFQN